METNSLFYRVNKETETESWTIEIRLDDKCKNGHQDFSITGTAYEKGKPHADNYMIHGGACGDEIAKLWPEFAIFNRLHLCDYNGAPMFAIGNGMYHTDTVNGMSPERFCEYYRVTMQEYKKLASSREPCEYYHYLVTLGILDLWKKEADDTIKQLEALTGNTFICDSKRTQVNVPTEDETHKFLTRLASGYYTVKAKKARDLAAKKQAHENLKNKLSADYDKAIKKINDEFVIDGYLLRLFIALKIDAKKCGNYIYYNHEGKISLNFNSYDQFTDKELTAIKEKILRDKRNGKKETKRIKEVDIYKH